jgi:phytoene dehydrogenase-like protein
MYLARAGWKTLVLERNAQAGGAVRSAEITRPGFVSDLYATNLNLFAGSPVFAELGEELGRHGFGFAHSAAPFASAFPGAKWLGVYQDGEKTLDGLRRHSSEDAAGWQRLGADYARFAPTIFGLYGAPIGSPAEAEALLAGWKSLGSQGMLELVRILVSSVSGMNDKYLTSPETKALLAAWALHVDLGPDVAGGALLPFLEAFTDMQTGMSISAGGASKLIDAMAGVLRDAGGELRLSAPVARVSVSDGRATGVVLEDGERIKARRAVIANLTPGVLHGKLLAGEGEKLREVGADYRYGPGTLMVHLALKGAVPWAASELGQFAYVHIAPYTEDLAGTYYESRAGLLPAEPLLVVGQTSVVDPSRAPAGEQVLWIQVRAAPAAIRGDAAKEIAATSWEAAAGPFADRVIAKLERHAPGLGERILDRVVLTPLDLERENPNLVGGDAGGGSAHLDQSFVFRPFPGSEAYASGVEDLTIVGAGTWPGAGVNALSGYHAAQRLIDPKSRRIGTKLKLRLAAAAARQALAKRRSHAG